MGAINHTNKETPNCFRVFLTRIEKAKPIALNYYYMCVIFTQNGENPAKPHCDSWILQVSNIKNFYMILSVLLEGSPGVGKTSLIVALGKYSGNNVVRINLSEQVCLVFFNIFLLQASTFFPFTFITIVFLHIKHVFCIPFSLILQTDIMDLLGSDLPVESDEGMKFAWSDGILLQVVNILIPQQICYFLIDVFILFSFLTFSSFLSGIKKRMLGFVG